MGKRTPPPDDGLEFDWDPLRVARVVVDVPQRKLGAGIGAGANAVVGWEKGRGEGPTVKQFYRIARFLGVRFEDLVTVSERGVPIRWPRRRHRDDDR